MIKSFTPSYNLKNGLVIVTPLKTESVIWLFKISSFQNVINSVIRSDNCAWVFFLNFLNFIFKSFTSVKPVIISNQSLFVINFLYDNLWLL